MDIHPFQGFNYWWLHAFPVHPLHRWDSGWLDASPVCPLHRWGEGHTLLCNRGLFEYSYQPSCGTANQIHWLQHNLGYSVWKREIKKCQGRGDSWCNLIQVGPPTNSLYLSWLVHQNCTLWRSVPGLAQRRMGASSRRWRRQQLEALTTCRDW